MKQLKFFNPYLLDSFINSIKRHYKRLSENFVKIYDFKVCLIIKMCSINKAKI